MSMVYEKETSGAEVQKVVDEKLLPALAGVGLDVAVAACFTLLVTQMMPTITSDQIEEAIKQGSAWLCSWLDSIDPANAAAKVN